MNEKKSLIVIISLIIICLGLGGYLVYDKILKNQTPTENIIDKNDKNTDNTKVEEELDLDSEIVKRLYSYVDAKKIGQYGGEYNLTDLYADGTGDTSVFHPYTAILMGYINLVNKGTIPSCSAAMTEISKNTLTNAIREIYGPTYNIEYRLSLSGDITEDSLFNPQSDNTYIVKNGSCGGPYEGEINVVTQLVKATKFDDRIELIVKASYITYNALNPDELIYEYHANYSQSSKVVKTGYTDDINIDEIESQRMIFTKNGENYFLTKTERI